MKLNKGISAAAIIFVLTVSYCPYLSKNAHAQEAKGPLSDKATAGQNSGMFSESPKANEFVGDSMASVPTAGVPRDGAAPGNRISKLPDSATITIVGNQAYYLDSSGIYYMPCDNDSAYCVVAQPES